jgi:hypothetical protein
VTENKITGKDDLFDGALLSGSIGGIAGAAGELIPTGVNAGWKKYGSSITAGAKNLDQWGGSALDWTRNLEVIRGQEFAGGIPGGTKWGFNAWDDSANPASQQFMAMASSDGIRPRILQAKSKITGDVY